MIDFRALETKASLELSTFFHQVSAHLTQWHADPAGLAGLAAEFKREALTIENKLFSASTPVPAAPPATVLPPAPPVQETPTFTEPEQPIVLNAPVSGT